jgi:non-ribosomal peptide synthetase component E (peptide arylation enzyme)
MVEVLMGKVARYTQAMIDDYVKKGFWTDQLTVDFWERNAELYPDDEALVDSTFRVTWSEGVEMVHRITAKFLDLGIKKDGVILCQLYNSVPLTLTRLACEKAGILVAIVGTKFRETEIAAVLARTQSVGAVFPAHFRRFDFFKMYSEMKERFEHLKHLFVVGESAAGGSISFYDMMQDTYSLERFRDELDKQKFTPFEFTEITTTSGSTGIPKCVEWVACARLATGREYVKDLEMTRHDVVAAVSPSISGSAETLIHRTPPQLGAKTVMLEHFTPEQACALIEKEGVTAVGAVPTHLVRLVNFPGLKDYDLRTLRFIQVSGGLLPYHLGVETEQKLSCKVVQGYGGMDIGAVAAGYLSAPQEIRLKTVGRILRGNEVTLLDPESGEEIPQGEVGLVTVEGPHCVGGYFQDPTATPESRMGGKFNMGDLGTVDRGGNLYLRGRVKDVIIRGGQTIYPKEIEELLVEHPMISEAALVRMPDVEMGERACAFVVAKKGVSFNFEQMVSFFKERQLAPYKIPERLECVKELPLVPGGNKINKRELEERLKAALQSEAT